MAKKKKLTPEQELRQWRDRLTEAFERWGEIKMHGCRESEERGKRKYA